MIFYFSYGSNISSKRMKLERNINFISRKFAILENYKMVFNKVSKNNNLLGYANIIELQGSIVEGALYEITNSDLQKIDKYEGVPNHYYRKYINVTCDSKIIQSIVYIANNSMIRENINPDKLYLSYILEGQDIFSSEYFNLLLNTITID